MEKLSNDVYQARCRDLEENLKQVLFQMEEAALRSGRSPQEITLLAATKTVAPEIINHAIELGLRCIGENRVQELCEKFDSLHRAKTDIQFIGRLQTNKVRQLMGKVSMIQSVDSARLAQEISRQCQKQGLSMNLLVEVNIGKEENKSGIFPEQLEELLQNIAPLPCIAVRGLMAIPPANADSKETSGFFSRMFQYFVDIKTKKIDNVSMDYLSMGMSADYPEAIIQGANVVRVGSALFGRRNAR